MRNKHTHTVTHTHTQRHTYIYTHTHSTEVRCLLRGEEMRAPVCYYHPPEFCFFHKARRRERTGERKEGDEKGLERGKRGMRGRRGTVHTCEENTLYEWKGKLETYFIVEPDKVNFLHHSISSFPPTIFTKVWYIYMSAVLACILYL